MILRGDAVLSGYSTDGILRRTTREFAAHYHTERNHQGLNNQLIEPSGREAPGSVPSLPCSD